MCVYGCVRTCVRACVHVFLYSCMLINVRVCVRAYYAYDRVYVYGMYIFCMCACVRV